jgi:hypothetical protein
MVHCIFLSLFIAFLNLVVMIGRVTLQQELVMLTEFKMHVEDPIVNVPL